MHCCDRQPAWLGSFVEKVREAIARNLRVIEFEVPTYAGETDVRVANEAAMALGGGVRVVYYDPDRSGGEIRQRIMVELGEPLSRKEREHHLERSRRQFAAA